MEEVSDQLNPSTFIISVCIAVVGVYLHLGGARCADLECERPQGVAKDHAEERGGPDSPGSARLSEGDIHVSSTPTGALPRLFDEEAARFDEGQVVLATRSDAGNNYVVKEERASTCV